MSVNSSAGLTVFRVITALLFVFLVAMLYWSSLLIESDLKEVKQQLNEINHDIENLKTGKQLSTTSPTAQVAISSLADEKYENLLESDPFYEKMLPEMLGKNFYPHGTRHEDLLGRPETLHPFNSYKEISRMHLMCGVTVANTALGSYEKLTPNMALKIEARPLKGAPTAFEYWIFLRKDGFWQPLKQDFFSGDIVLSEHFLKKHPVTAYDFKFYFNALMNENLSEPKAAALRNYYKDIEEIEVIDPYTFVVRWKTHLVPNDTGEFVPKVKYMAKQLTAGLQALPCFVYQYFADGQKILDDDSDPNTYRVNSVWAQNFSEHWAKNIIVSAGSWKFDGMSDQGIRFLRNKNYYLPLEVLVEGEKISFKESFEGIWQDFKAGKIDNCILAPNQLGEYKDFLQSPLYQSQKEAGNEIKSLEYVAMSYNYIGWNQKKPLFQSKNVRVALTMAINRNRIIQQNLNGMGVPITGTFYPFSPAYDPSIQPWPFDPERAKQLLEQEGWVDLDGDGIREKMIDGKAVPFRFTLNYYVKNLISKIISEQVSTALKEIGIDCRLNGLDIADLSHAFEDKTFDAIYFGWALGTPPEDPRQIWHSSGANEKGSSNAISFQNAEVDSIIDQLQYEYNPEKRQALYYKFDHLIHEEAPYTFLYAPKSLLIYRSYLKDLFIPRESQNLTPGAIYSEPEFRAVWIEGN